MKWFDDFMYWLAGDVDREQVAATLRANNARQYEQGLISFDTYQTREADIANSLLPDWRAVGGTPSQAFGDSLRENFNATLDFANVANTKTQNLLIAVAIATVAVLAVYFVVKGKLT